MTREQSAHSAFAGFVLAILIILAGVLGQCADIDDRVNNPDYRVESEFTKGDS